MTNNRHERLTEIFLAALEIPEGEERNAFVIEACAEDNALYVEAAELLKHAKAEPLLSAAPKTGEHELAMPDTGGGGERYEVGNEIARGGTSKIVSGHDRLLDRDVALKVLLNSSESNADGVGRMITEARICGRLQHPGIPPIHDIGKLPNGSQFIALKLVGGKTLHTLLNGRESPKSDLTRYLGIFEQVCQTIAFAHSHQVIHRDIKPHNIMVDEFGSVQVMDWGLAHDLRETGSIDELSAFSHTANSVGKPGETKIGLLAGTPEYMAPEQAIGRRDKRTDVFQLGALLTEILTGKPPWESDSRSDVLVQAAAGDIEAALNRLNTCGANSELVEIAKSCLAIEPDDRPDDASFVTTLIDDYLQSVAQRLHAAELSVAEEKARADSERKRRVLWLSLGGTATVSTIATILALGWIYLRDIEARQYENQRAKESLNIAKALFGEATRASIENVTLWVSASAAAEQAAQHAREDLVSDEVRAAAETLLDQVSKRKRDREIVHAIEQSRLGNAITGLSDWNDKRFNVAMETMIRSFGFLKPEPEIEQIETLVGELSQPVRTQFVSKWNEWVTLPRDNSRTSNFRWRRRVLEEIDPDEWREKWRALHYANDHVGLIQLADDPATLDRSATDIVNLALSLRPRKGDHTTTPIAIALLERSHFLHPDNFWINFRLAQFLGRMGPSTTGNRYIGEMSTDRGLLYSQTALALRPCSTTWYIHGILLHFSEKYDDAQKALERAIQLEPERAPIYAHLGTLFVDMERGDRAIEAFLNAVELDPKNPSYRFLLGTQLMVRGDIDAAEAHFKAAEPYAKKKSGPYSRLGKMLSEAGYPKRAAEAYRMAVEIDPQSGGNWHMLALTCLSLDRNTEAVEASGKAVSAQPDRDKFQLIHGICLYESGAHEEALTVFRRTLSRPSARGFLDARLLMAAVRSAISVESGIRMEDPEEADLLRHLTLEWLERFVELIEENGQADGDHQVRQLFESKVLAPLRDEEQIRNLPKSDQQEWHRIWTKLNTLQLQFESQIIPANQQQ